MDREYSEKKERYAELLAKGVDNMGIMELSEFMDVGIWLLRAVIEGSWNIFLTVDESGFQHTN